MKKIDPFEEASDLLRLDPLPSDTVEQLDKIRKRVPMNQRSDFGMFYESAAMLMPPPEPPEPGLEP